MQTNDATCSLHWPAPTAVPADLTIAVDPQGLASVDAATLATESRNAVERWLAVTCSGPMPPRVELAPATTPTASGGECVQVGDHGGCNKWRENGNFVHGTHAEPWVFGAGTIAITVLSYDACSGELADADVLVNDQFHIFCGGGDCPAEAWPLCTVLTHEFGHFFGLDHSAAAGSTMAAYDHAGDVAGCTLEADDRAGLCALYADKCHAGCLGKIDAESAAGHDGRSRGHGTGACTAGRSGGSVAVITGLVVLLSWGRRRYGGGRIARR